MKAPIAEINFHYSTFWQVVRNGWGTIAGTVLLMSLVAMGVSHMLERQKVGRVRLAIHHYSERDRTNWFETEYNTITSNETMMLVVRELNLTKTWNVNGDERAAMTKLSRMVETQTTKEGDRVIIVIEVYSPEAKEAVMLANAVAEAYEQRHRENEIERAQERQRQAINILAKEMEGLRKQVESKRSETLRIKEEYQIVDFSAIDVSSAHGSEIDGGQETIYDKVRRHAAEYKREMQRLELQLNTLLAITDPEDLLAQVATMQPYGVPMGGAISALDDARRNLAMLKADGLSEGHSKVKAAQELVKTLSEQLSMSVEDFKSTLRFKINISKDSLALIIEERTKKDDDRLTGDKKKYVEYLSANRECAQQSALLEEMQEESLKQHYTCGMPMAPLHTLERAAQGQAVVRSNTLMVLAVSASVGLVFGIALVYFRESMRPSPAE